MHDLNPQQKEALRHSSGPLLVFAGAGSGKTKVIAHKYSYLLKTKKLRPDSIFTVTFTNKAADEMKERITALLEKDMHSAWIGTFHSQCNRILRQEIHSLDYKNNFSIYDEDDRCSLVRHILKDFKIYEALYKGIVSRISYLKASLINPEEFLSTGDGFGFDEKLAKVYVRYQDELKRSNALDFDDLIMVTVNLFQQNQKLLEKYQNENLGDNRLRVVWSPVLPQDIERLVASEQILIQNGIHSRKRAMDEIGIKDPEIEFNRWLKEREIILKMNKELNTKSVRSGTRGRAIPSPAEGIEE